MTALLIVAVDRVVDGVGDLAETSALLEKFTARRLRVHEVHLAPLRMGWRNSIPEGFVRGACAPTEAMRDARKALENGTADAVVIDGNDPIRSEFENKKEERKKLMSVYGP